MLVYRVSPSQRESGGSAFIQTLSAKHQASTIITHSDHYGNYTNYLVTLVEALLISCSSLHGTARRCTRRNSCSINSQACRFKSGNTAQRGSGPCSRTDRTCDVLNSVISRTTEVLPLLNGTVSPLSFRRRDDHRTVPSQTKPSGQLAFS